MKCEKCQKETTLNKVQKYRYLNSALENVFLDNINTYNCGECETQVPIIPQILKLHNTISFAIVCKPSLLTGEELKFLRKNAGIKSQDWANLLRTDKSTYSRWESGQPLSLQSDLLVRLLYLRVIEEKRNVRVGKAVVENLADLTKEDTAIVVDVKQIENYSYLPMADAVRMSEEQHSHLFRFNFELGGSDNYYGEIEQPMPLGIVVNLSDYSKAAANNNMALAA